ncbi:MAG: extracellular solute-binding protein [Clostridia bacterium]|nr:extracellular solute-binding protein [Clostridia bacterium]
MKKHTRILAGLLVCFLAAGMISCSSGGTNEETAASDTAGQISAEPSAEPVEIPEEPKGNGRSEVKDSLPDTLDFEGVDVRVFSRGGDKDTLMEFSAEEMNGDVVNDAVFTRNLAVQERLNVVMDLILDTGLNRHSGAGNTIRASITAGSDDYDLIGNAMYNTMPLVVDNMFLPLNTLPYLDFSAPWYNQAFLETTNLNGNNYVIMGELSQTMISGTFSMFFNKTLFDEYYNGSENLYDIVNEGEWTLDKMAALCEPLYTDTNGDGAANEGDTFGHFFTDTKTLGADSFFGAAQIEYLAKTDDGTFVFNGTSERMVEFAEKMHKLLFQNNNTLRTPNNNDQIMDIMKNHQAVFTTWMLGGIDYLRDMEDDFGIIPMPKLNEAQEIYTSYIHDGSSAFTIPVTAQKTDVTAAYLEAMSAESYRTVTPAYFETAIKSKYSRDSETSQMLDLIVSGVYLDYSYIYGQSLGAPIDVIRGILADATSCENSQSKLKGLEKATLKMFDKVVEKYQDLLN